MKVKVNIFCKFFTIFTILINNKEIYPNELGPCTHEPSTLSHELSYNPLFYKFENI